MFKFDFQVDDVEENGSPFIEIANEKETDDSNRTQVDTIEWYESQEILPTKDMLENLDVYKLNSTETMAGDVTLTYMVSGFLLQHMESNEDDTQDITKAEQSHSDLIPGVYEGGAKIWECTLDLLSYLSKHYTAADMWKGKRVLDLGCGSGLLGIYSYKSGAKVHFQDYNRDVLEKITIPNALLNVPTPPNERDLDLVKLNEEIKFYSGDWYKYSILTKSDDNMFDIILTSETIYNVHNQKKLLDTVHAKLKPNGVVLVAAKTHYFGVGGGTRQFEELVLRDKRLQSKILWTASEGVGREIVELMHL